MNSLQKLEIAGRSAIIRAIFAASGLSRTSTVPDWRERPYRILFIRDDGIGDLLLSIEIIRAIASASSTFTVDLLCSPQSARVRRFLPFVTDVVVHRRGALRRSLPVWRELKRRKYDVVVDGRVALSAVNLQTAALLAASGSRWRVGICGRTNDFVYNVPVSAPPGTHAIDIMAELVRPFGIDPSSRDWRPALSLGEEESAVAERCWRDARGERPRVLVNITSVHRVRHWPQERFIPVVLRLRALLPGSTILVVGMPDERRIVDRIAATGSATALTPTLDELIALVAKADLVVTPDTAVTHMASAFERPTLVFQAQGFTPYTPYRTESRSVIADTRDLKTLPVARAVEAVEEFVASLSQRLPWK